MAALLGVLTFGTLQGVFIGLTLSLFWLVWRTSHPSIPVLGQSSDDTAYYSVENHPDAITHPGIVIIRCDGPVFFATASSLRDRVRELTTDVIPPVRALVLDMESTNIVDLEGSDELHDVATELNELQIGFYLCRTKVVIKNILVADGIYEAIPADHFYTSVHDAVKAAQKAAPQP
jgi:MFS superfamily sulfate permease-like transporter